MSTDLVREVPESGDFLDRAEKRRERGRGNLTKRGAREGEGISRREPGPVWPALEIVVFDVKDKA